MNTFKYRFGDEMGTEGPLEMDMTLKVRRYIDCPTNMAIVLYEVEGGAPECYGVATVNLGWDIGNSTIMPRNCAFLDVNNLPDIERFVQQAGLAVPYTRRGATVEKQSGWVSYPLYEFDEGMLAKADPAGWSEHVRCYEAGFRSALREMMSGMEG